MNFLMFVLFYIICLYLYYVFYKAAKELGLKKWCTAGFMLIAAPASFLLVKEFGYYVQASFYLISN